MIKLICTQLPKQDDSAALVQVLAEKIAKTVIGSQNKIYFHELAEKKDPAQVAESLSAYLLLANAAEKAGTVFSSMRLERSENGKPQFQIEKFHFNLSHSEGYVVCALSDEGPVGVDIEAKEPDAEKSVRLAERFFSPAEILAVRRDPKLFSSIWSAKEAEAKFFGDFLSVFLKSSKTQQENKILSPFRQNLRLHRFFFEKSPIFLCTKEEFQSVSFSFMPFDDLF